MALKFPGPTDRTAILGGTGSGKTTFATWLLSGTNFDLQPWVMVNTKGDPLINEIASIPGVQSIDVTETPGETGLYVINPLPDQAEELDNFFRRVWEKQNCGVYVDEGYMIEIKDGFNALLTQGRSRRIPMIVLSQRPAWISKFVFSEAEYVSVFRLRHADDRKNIEKFVPNSMNIVLPKHHSLWYNVADDELLKLQPVPAKERILQNFRASFPPNEAQITNEGPPSQQAVVGRKVIV